MAAGPDVLKTPGQPGEAGPPLPVEIAGSAVFPTNHPVKVVVAKVGLDGHEVGARVVARGLVEAGMEVVYTGLRRTPEQVVRTAIEEDADVIGISILSGAHMTLLVRIRELMTAEGLDDVLLVAGGIIPGADEEALLAQGIDAIFHPATPISEIARWIKGRIRS
jgi:methylmalonyl-CoA mutase C-terminal domain/subunit